MHARGEGPTLADLAAVGVLYERLPDDDFQGALDRLKAARGYVAQDVIELRPDTPNLDGLLAKFKDEHLHRDDEVRFVLDGEGIFDIRGADERWIRVQVERGDLIVVPADLYHRFFDRAAADPLRASVQGRRGLGAGVPRLMTLDSHCSREDQGRR
ncbi:1,2-dihydroxy-3-keto-5-methylthiopentene dioxygenase [Nannocystis pusilla]|uniref:1,2-dihydroxy-3-keto-5-methylthiopentene dioxygenase n=1 Tax=Nannocystis pusilla TaxID=889268 RepID=UPI003B7FB1C6